jgi:hypothetical protein
LLVMHRDSSSQERRRSDCQNVREHGRTVRPPTVSFRVELRTAKELQPNDATVPNLAGPCAAASSARG